MKFSKKSRYGLVALIDLAVQPETEYVALNTIAERNEISTQYLEQIFGSLRRAGVVNSVKGPQGGYRLSQKAQEIRVSQILEVLEGEYRLAEETGDSSISRTIQSMVVDPINDGLTKILEEITLEDLAKDYLRHQKGEELMYYI
ncbi:RrF2 family transcriptional regulator [Suipraeoptans intestinalis]|uniref:RrF2 family transcriptional regulator n=1 Tax=Suipraeoptans intestinalis TaxID=2606628 RepID=UPI0023F133BA|nr:Rrf2 family transcriptional regulator [Suipraeoptans intestinalis]MDD7770143.1 Rrf2 family transcriptional regulator [Suipraeoptans intestinalis]MDY3122294.1 Rrf2 family transcriptional regulator [Suipraeoptans intestinalis]